MLKAVRGASGLVIFVHLDTSDSVGRACSLRRLGIVVSRTR